MLQCLEKIYSCYIKGGIGSIDINNLHELSYGIDKDGYYRVVLSDNGNKRYVKVHTVIVEQFIGDVLYPMVVNHKDGNKKNNNISNLEIVSIKENTIHAHTNYLIKTDINVDIIYNNNIYHFNSKAECTRHFPDLSLDYLSQIQNDIVSFTSILFMIHLENNIMKILAIHNGQIINKFNSMKEADIYFNKSIGTVSSTFRNNNYRKKVNQYIVLFP